MTLAAKPGVVTAVGPVAPVEGAATGVGLRHGLRHGVSALEGAHRRRLRQLAVDPAESTEGVRFTARVLSGNLSNPGPPCR